MICAYFWWYIVVKNSLLANRKMLLVYSFSLNIRACKLEHKHVALMCQAAMETQALLHRLKLKLPVLIFITLIFQVWLTRRPIIHITVNLYSNLSFWLQIDTEFNSRERCADTLLIKFIVISRKSNKKDQSGVWVHSHSLKLNY